MTTALFNPRVPKRLISNLQFRRNLIARGLNDPDFADAMIQASSDDILFWINTCVWTYNPRKKKHKKLPFITWAFQDDAIARINAAIEDGHDLLGEKSRDMGFTWMVCCVFVWRVLFRSHENFLMGSRKDELVDGDSGRDQKTLFSKVDWILKNLPGWMTPNFTRTASHLFNHDTGSGIDGESTNSDFGRGDRRTAIFLDEFPAVENGEEILSATADTTDCRIFCGTPKGARGAFYRLRQHTPIEKIRLHWSIHPEKGAGLYTTKDGKLEILDKEYEFPPDYPFVVDGRMRSPWYDAERKRRSSEQEIAQELDICYHGSGANYFDIPVIERLEKECTQPLLEGELDFDADFKPVEFVPRQGGSVRLWSIIPDARDRMPMDRRFAVGCDISAGTGASNSVATVIDCKTGEKVCEFAHARLKPYEFADAVVAISRWYNDAYLTWETGGPGHEFGDQVLKDGYRNIFYSRDEARFDKKESQRPGWYPTPANKNMQFGEYRRALDKGEFVNLSRESLGEAREYVYGPMGYPEHNARLGSDHGTGAKKTHGDRVTADVLAWLGASITGDKSLEVAQDTPPDSFAGRRLQREREEEAKGEWDGGKGLGW